MSVLTGFALSYGLVAKLGAGPGSSRRVQLFSLGQGIAGVFGLLFPTLLEALLGFLGPVAGALLFASGGALLGALVPFYESCIGVEEPSRRQQLYSYVFGGAFLAVLAFNFEGMLSLGQSVLGGLAFVAALASAVLAFLLGRGIQADPEPAAVEAQPAHKALYPASLLMGALFSWLLLTLSQILQFTLGASETVLLKSALVALLGVFAGQLVHRAMGSRGLLVGLGGLCLAMIALAIWGRGVPERQTEFLAALVKVSQGEGSLASLQNQSLFWTLTPLLFALSLASQGLTALAPTRATWQTVGAAKALGGLGGAALTTYALVPSLGLRWTLLLGLAALAALALLFAFFERESRVKRALIVLLVGAVSLGLAGATDWPERSLIHGKDSPALKNRMVFYKVNASTIVTVDDDDERNLRSLRQDGRFLGAIPIDPKQESSADLSSPLAQAAYPVLLSPKPESVCVLGLDTGVLLGALLTYEVKTVDAVESQPLIIDALRDKGELFSFMNNRALDDERLSLHSEDPVAFLMSRPGQYDIICAKPLYPWLTTNARFHTQDFYHLVKSSLTETGIFCLSVSAEGVDKEALASQLATFLSVFPEAVVFRPPGTQTILALGGVEKVSIDELRKRLRTRGRSKARKRRSTHPRDLLSCFISGSESLKTLTVSASIETSDNPALQRRLSQLGFVPESLTEKNLEDLSQGSKDLLDWLRGPLFQRHQLLHACAETRALRGSLESARLLIQVSFDRVEELEKEEDRKFISSQGHRLLGDLIFRNARSLTGRDLQIYTKSAFQEWEQALKINPKNVAARRSISVYHLNRRDYKAAIEALEPGLTGDRKEDAPLQFVMGRIYEAQKNYQQSWAAYKAAGSYGQARQRATNVRNLAEQAGIPIQEAFGPRMKDIPLLVAAGRRHLNAKRWVEAASVFRKVIDYEPEKLSHRYRLVYAYRGGKSWERAHKAVDEILKIKPSEVRALQLRASLFDLADEPKKALAAWLDCASKQEGQFSSVKSLTEAARLHIRLGQSKKALEALRQASVIVPENVLVELYRGTAYAALGEKDNATKHYEKYLKLSPESHPMRPRIQRWLAENKRK